MGKRARKREDWRQRCEWCNALLPDTATARKRFCNRKCKERDYSALVGRERAAARAKLKCQHCGKRIKGAKRARKYCSLRCQERARYRRHVEKRRAYHRAYYRRLKDAAGRAGVGAYGPLFRVGDCRT